MGLLTLRRIPEPEIMDSDDEVDAYSSAAAQAHLEAIDKTFVDHLARLLAPVETLAGYRVLDFACGPGQIPILMARRWPDLSIVGVDAGPNMLTRAKHAAAAAGVDIRWQLVRLGAHGDRHLPFEDDAFDAVVCNSTLHHLLDPLGALNEVARIVKPSGAVLIRDLKRPSALAYPFRVRISGRHYKGEMRRLYVASVRAAYDLDEVRRMLENSGLNDGRARVFRHGVTHLGIERAALPGTPEARAA
jgi:ubiquinone/menaquinone biosynthesis C-methylase UbiE